MNENRSTKGAGPDALPPNTPNLAPAGRILDTSQFNTCPAYRELINLRNAFAHPSLLSATTMVSSTSNKVLGISGNLLIYCLSTEKPTPVPHNNIYIASSKAFGSSMGK